MERRWQFILTQFVLPFLVGVGIAVVIVTWRTNVPRHDDEPAMMAQPSMIIEPMAQFEELKVEEDQQIAAEPKIEEEPGPAEFTPMNTPPKPDDAAKRKLRAERAAKGSWTCRHRSTKWLEQNSQYLPSELREYLQRYNRLHDKSLKELSVEEAFQTSLTSVKNNVRYIVWRPVGEDLAGQILSLTSAFLLALLTDRILLINLPYVRLFFCEPFTRSSWIFPQKHLADLNNFTVMRNALQTRTLLRVTRLKLKDGFQDDDSIFLTCNGNLKTMIAHSQILLVESPVGFVELLAANPSHRNRLNHLFQDRPIYTLLMHHLLHPSNDMWFRIIDTYHVHYTNDVERPSRLGVHLPVVGTDAVESFKLRHKMQCALRKHIDLPTTQGRIIYYSPSGPTNDPRLWAKRQLSIPMGYKLVTSTAENSKKGYLGDWRRLLTDIWMGSWTHVFVIGEMTQAALATHYYRAKESWVLEQQAEGEDCNYVAMSSAYLLPVPENLTDCPAFRQEWRAKYKKVKSQ
ncbi:hypothetical protein PSACC_03068 [Paramicrosporidium saccamoebae]|uniref:Uncharacterized protein n=1 Tax=Paramicrosporidium saccamoebae TaxID=1246581 RepID=A0A2H9TH66_9FUNG|nr:hypothetical protein PSACC_03068 [Paramicrosporidium saccamoebae]